MFASGPTFLCTNIARPLDQKDLRSHAQKSYAYSEIKASELFGHSPEPSEPNVELNRSTPCTSISSDPTMIKKLYHNANERDRRKKINKLYLTLRSLLPAADQTVHKIFLHFCFGFLRNMMKLKEESSSSH